MRSTTGTARPHPISHSHGPSAASTPPASPEARSRTCFGPQRPRSGSAVSVSGPATRGQRASGVRLRDGGWARANSDMQGGRVDELLDVGVECPAIDQLEVEVSCTLKTGPLRSARRSRGTASPGRASAPCLPIARSRVRREDVGDRSAAEGDGAHRLDGEQCEEDTLARAQDDQKPRTRGCRRCSSRSLRRYLVEPGRHCASLRSRLRPRQGEQDAVHHRGQEPVFDPGEQGRVSTTGEEVGAITPPQYG